MQNKILLATGILALIAASRPGYTQENVKMTQTASYIEMTAAAEKHDDLANFLSKAAPLVKETEPGTALWFALQGGDNTLAIFDVFENAAARDAHFDGAVAGALNAHAGELVAGGWEQGVVANIHNASVLSAKAPTSLYSANIASYITLKSADGQGDALAALLTAAGPIVSETEPKTLYWAALRMDKNHFAIFDIFADESGMQAHFAGQVANLLKEKSSVLVDGGWDEGVVANINNFTILAIK